ncbi:MAG: isoprenylcysteine carboxylmethyltransferase family protein [Gemmatimonadota bacterium]
MKGTNPSGAIHPTIFLILWFAVGFGLERVMPLELPGATALAPLTVVLFLAGGVLFVWSALELRRSGTTTEHGQPTTVLVTDGPYAFSRHPIYLALVCILLGLAIRSASVWFVMVTAVFWIAVQWFTVRKEDAYLASQFPEPYARYKGSVRQWI